MGLYQDHIEFGCFGTLAHYSSLYHAIYFTLFSFGELLERKEICERDAATSANLIDADITDDFRDFMRRKGIWFYGKRFKSIRKNIII